MSPFWVWILFSCSRKVYVVQRSDYHCALGGTEQKKFISIFYLSKKKRQNWIFPYQQVLTIWWPYTGSRKPWILFLLGLLTAHKYLLHVSFQLWDPKTGAATHVHAPWALILSGCYYVESDSNLSMLGRQESEPGKRGEWRNNITAIGFTNSCSRRGTWRPTECKPGLNCSIVYTRLLETEENWISVQACW